MSSNKEVSNKKNKGTTDFRIDEAIRKSLTHFQGEPTSQATTKQPVKIVKKEDKS